MASARAGGVRDDRNTLPSGAGSGDKVRTFFFGCVECFHPMIFLFGDEADDLIEVPGSGLRDARLNAPVYDTRNFLALLAEGISDHTHTPFFEPLEEGIRDTRDPSVVLQRKRYE